VTLSDRPVNTPKWSANVAVDADLFTVGGGSVALHADYYYKSSMARDAANTPELLSRPQDVIGMNVGWTAPNQTFEMLAGVKNLTDDRFYRRRQGSRRSRRHERDPFASPRVLRDRED
jgi:iron complex outermembrane receptor protein